MNIQLIKWFTDKEIKSLGLIEISFDLRIIVLYKSYFRNRKSLKEEKTVLQDEIFIGHLKREASVKF